MDCRKGWYSAAEAAEYIGVTRQSIYNLIDQGLLAAYKIKGLRGRRIKKEDLDALFERIDSGEAEEGGEG